MLNINGKTMIFQNKRGFATTIGRKLEDDTYENMFIPLSFVDKESEAVLQDRDVIEITKAFPSYFVTKDGVEVLKVVVQEFQITEEAPKEKPKTTRPKVTRPSAKK